MPLGGESPITTMDKDTVTALRVGGRGIATGAMELNNALVAHVGLHVCVDGRIYIIDAVSALWGGTIGLEGGIVLVSVIFGGLAGENRFRAIVGADALIVGIQQHSVAIGGAIGVEGNIERVWTRICYWCGIVVGWGWIAGGTCTIRCIIVGLVGGNIVLHIGYGPKTADAAHGGVDFWWEGAYDIGKWNRMGHGIDP